MKNTIKAFEIIALAIIVSMTVLSLTGCSNPAENGDKILVSIAVTPPTKTQYNLGEDLVLTGMVVTATYSDGSTAPVTNYTVSGYDKTKTGEQIITVTWQGKTAAFTVNVAVQTEDGVIYLVMGHHTNEEDQIVEQWGSSEQIKLSDFTTRQLEQYDTLRFKISGVSDKELKNIRIEIFQNPGGDWTNFIWLGASSPVDLPYPSFNDYIIGDITIWGDLIPDNIIYLQLATIRPILTDIPDGTIMATIRDFSISLVEDQQWGDYRYSEDNSGIIIISYEGAGGSVTIPAQINGKPVTSIGSSAFEYCAITSVTIPNSVKSIGDCAFFCCDSLTSVTIPNSVTSIGQQAFSFCDSLTAINVDTSNTAYSSDNGVLYNKNKTTLTQYPAGKTGSSFTIPNSVTSIGDGAFRGCNSLTSITIPSSVTYIGWLTFSSCNSLTSVTIPNGVTSIEDGAFSYCTNLTAINVDAGNTAYSSQEGVLYNKNKITLVAYPAGKTGSSFTIPNSVISIRDYAFVSCISLTSVTIPSSVNQIGDSAFSWCYNLTSVTFQGTITAGNFHDEAFDGDLRDKYLTGDTGTYTRASGGTVWTKQP